jgi:hypothetical protein
MWWCVGLSLGALVLFVERSVQTHLSEKAGHCVKPAIEIGHGQTRPNGNRFRVGPHAM